VENSSLLLSIIIPVYNRSSRVSHTVQSVLDQRGANFELILVNDGSTDDTLAVLSSFAGPSVRVLSKENGERGAARNFGADHANGNYLIFFDSDDLMYTGYLAKAAEFISQTQRPPVCYCGFEIRGADGDVKKKVQKGTDNWKRELATDNFLGCDSVIIRTDVFRQFRFSESRAMSTFEDKELWLRVSAFYPFVPIPVVGFAMVDHADRSLNAMNAARLENAVAAFVSSLKSSDTFLNSFGRIANYLFAHEYSLVSSYWSKTGDKKKAQKFLREAYTAYPPIIFTKRFLAALKNLLV
jgi:glycosyltransferase involved in cell wall biosynthesis